jgi:epsilon-lactone hydrolase
MDKSEIDAIRSLLSAKPRPESWDERRKPLDEVGSVWPAAPDISLEPVMLGGLPGEWSRAPAAMRRACFFTFMAAAIARARS